MKANERILALRKAKKYSQKDMAVLLKYKSASGYGQIESGKYPLTVEKFIEICKILEVESYDSLLPPLPNAKSEIEEDLLINGRAAFNLIRTHGTYLRKEIEGLIDRLNAGESVDKDKLIGDLELFVSFLHIINSESFKHSAKFNDRLEVILHGPVGEG